MQAKKILQRNPVVVIISKLTMLHGFAKKTYLCCKARNIHTGENLAQISSVWVV